MDKKAVKGIKYWWFVFSYVFFIYITLPVMRDVLRFIYKTIGREILIEIISVSIIITIILIFFLFWKRKRYGFWRLAGIIFIISIYIVWVFQLDIPEERVHFMEYGILGIMVYNGFNSNKMKIFFLAIVITAIFGTIDELIQWFLPNRVGDIRDVIVNAVSGMLGVWLGYLYRF